METSKRLKITALAMAMDFTAMVVIAGQIKEEIHNNHQRYLQKQHQCFFSLGGD